MKRNFVYNENHGNIGSNQLAEKLENNTPSEQLELDLAPGTYDKAGLMTAATAAGYAGTMTTVAHVEVEGVKEDTNGVAFTLSTEGMTATNYAAGGSRAIGKSPEDAGGDLVELGDIEIVVPATASARVRLTVF